MEHEKYFAYFDRAVLNFYRANSHAYHLKEDDMGGQIKISDNWEENMNSRFPFIDIKFAFKKLSDNIICVGVFMPSFKDKISQKDHQKWLAFHLQHPIFHENNPAFDRWVERYVLGSWEVDDGPRIKIIGELELINSVTRCKFQLDLFKNTDNRLINYPIAENNEEYTKSVLELYRLLIDGMSHECIIKIAVEREVVLENGMKRLNSLKAILPDKFHSLVYKPLQKISRNRMPIHGLPSKGIVAYPAFDSFGNVQKTVIVYHPGRSKVNHFSRSKVSH